jgi:hypothetical protein
VTHADGRVFWFSETLRTENGTTFVSGHRIVVQRQDGTFNSRAKQPKGGPSDGAGLGSDGRVYTAGGNRECQTLTGACKMPPVEAWTPSTNAWTKPTVMRRPRIFAGVTGDSSGRIWTIAGLRADGSNLFWRVEVYRPSTGNWAKAANLPERRYGVIAAFTPDGRVWVIQGFDQFGNPHSDGYVFSPT